MSDYATFLAQKQRVDRPQTVHIYALTDPETGMPRYVGKSVRPLERLANHLNDHGRCHRTNWLRSLRARGLRPGIVLLESIDGAWPWQEAERYWIARGRQLGWDLTNSTAGGDGVIGLPEQSRERIRRTWLGRKHAPESIAKMAAASSGRRHSAETRAKMSAAHSGRTITWGPKLSTALCKLTAEQQAEIHARLTAGEKVTELAAVFGVHRTTISKVKAGGYAPMAKGGA